MLGKLSWRFWVFYYFLQACAKFRVWPWRYFYTNLSHLDSETGIYSKFRINELVPEKWKLKTILIDRNQAVSSNFKLIKNTFLYPVFLKPEWGQNSFGVYKIDTNKKLKNVLEKVSKSEHRYICQEAAEAENEYDFFYITEADKTLYFSATRSISPYLQGDGRRNIKELLEIQFPKSDREICFLSSCSPETVLGEKEKIRLSYVNSIYDGTSYSDVSEKFGSDFQEALLENFKEILDSSMFRVSLIAKSVEAIKSGDFKVIEINLFTPFPLNLLDKNLPENEQKRRIKLFSYALAQGLRTQKTGFRNPMSKVVKLLWENNKILNSPL